MTRRSSTIAIALTLFLTGAAPAEATRGEVAFKVVATGSTPDPGNHPKTAGRLLRSRAAAEKLLREWDLDRAIPKLAGFDFSANRLVVLVARGNDAAARLDVRGLSLTGTKLTATGKVERGSGTGAQVISLPYTLVSVPKAKVARVSSVRLKLG